MTTGRIIELVAALALLVAAVVLYRRRDPQGGSYGNQGAVILLVVAVIMGIHGLGGLDYQWLNCGAHKENPHMKLLPSEYFKRQVYGCFWFEKDTLKPALDKTVAGAYPNRSGTQPPSVRTIAFTIALWWIV